MLPAAACSVLCKWLSHCSMERAYEERGGGRRRRLAGREALSSRRTIFCVPETVAVLPVIPVYAATTYTSTVSLIWDAVLCVQFGWLFVCVFFMPC